MEKKALIALVFELGYTIAVPLVLFALGGRFLDKRLGTSPLFLLVGIFLSLMGSSYLIYKIIRKYS
ncbi:MAG: AtpZ/AtpI family protein [bacterium]